jgi:hypothetical protein
MSGFQRCAPQPSANRQRQLTTLLSHSACVIAVSSLLLARVRWLRKSLDPEKWRGSSNASTLALLRGLQPAPVPVIGKTISRRSPVAIGHCDALMATVEPSLFKNATTCSPTSSGFSKTMLCPQLGMPASQVFGRFVATLKAFCGTATLSSKP